MFLKMFDYSILEASCDSVKLHMPYVSFNVERNGIKWAMTIYDTGQVNLTHGWEDFSGHPILKDYPKDGEGLDRMFILAEELLGRQQTNVTE